MMSDSPGQATYSDIPTHDGLMRDGLMREAPTQDTPIREAPTHDTLMREALNLAHKAFEAGDIPVGALVTLVDNTIIGKGYNQREQPPFDPTAHAEILALRQAAQTLGTWRLDGCRLIVTLEPCAMCAGAIVSSRIQTLIFGAWDPKAGACGSTRDIVRDPRLNHTVEVYGGILAASSASMLRAFFDRDTSASKCPRNKSPLTRRRL